LRGATIYFVMRHGFETASQEPNPSRLVKENRSEFSERFESEMFVERRSALITFDHGQLNM